MSWLTLLLIRHGESLGNQQQRMMGQLDDELSSQGQEQVGQLANRFRQESWFPTQVYTSPLKRARQTAEILHREWLVGLDPVLKDAGCEIPSLQVLEALQEFHNGIFQGLTWAEAQQHYPELCATLETSLDWIQIPEAESLPAIRDRAHWVVQELIHRHATGGRIVVVTHSYFLQQLWAVLLGCDRTWGFAVHPTARFELAMNLEFYGQLQKTDPNLWNTSLWQIKRFNDCNHLNS